MAKVIMTIAPEDGMCFEEILSFKTENYVGVWNGITEEFLLIRGNGICFEPWCLDEGYESLRELDDAVYEICEEHITEVFDRINYTIELD